MLGLRAMFVGLAVLFLGPMGAQAETRDIFTCDWPITSSREMTFEKLGHGLLAARPRPKLSLPGRPRFEGLAVVDCNRSRSVMVVYVNDLLPGESGGFFAGQKADTFE